MLCDIIALTAKMPAHVLGSAAPCPGLRHPPIDKGVQDSLVWIVLVGPVLLRCFQGEEARISRHEKARSTTMSERASNRERDLNPRNQSPGLPEYQSGAFNHSATPPYCPKAGWQTFKMAFRQAKFKWLIARPRRYGARSPLWTAPGQSSVTACKGRSGMHNQMTDQTVG